MRYLALAVCLVLSAASASTVRAQPGADRGFAQMASGVYLLTQKDGSLRLLTIDRDGIASQVSQHQTTLGYTAGQGAWSRSGDAEITAQIIDFDFDPRDGNPTGATLIQYVLTLSAREPGGFQHVAGAMSGTQFPPGQNPRDSNGKPIQALHSGVRRAAHADAREEVATRVR